MALQSGNIPISNNFVGYGKDYPMNHAEMNGRVVGDWPVVVPNLVAPVDNVPVGLNPMYQSSVIRNISFTQAISILLVGLMLQT